MSTLTINLEIGHDSALREKTTTEGFTHDWEVFVRGCNGADIRHYVDRVVFHLHETFEKPKRVVKDPPYSVRTSGYAGFNLPIQIHLKNNQEPRKIQFNYDLQLQPCGPPIHEVQKEKYTFHSVSEDFRNKLLKGGAVLGVAPASTDNLSSIQSAKPEEKSPMTSKPRLSGSEQPKKYKLKPEEPRSDQFTNLFGTPITKSSKITEQPKSKDPPTKPVVRNSDKDKGEKVSSDKDKNKAKSLYKDKDRDKEKDREKSKDKDKQTENSNYDRKLKDDKKDKRDKKDREYSKKDKKERKERDRDKSPPARLKSNSPKRSPKRTRSPSPVKSGVKEVKEKDKELRESKDRDRDREKKSKKHKEKDGKHREKDKERERDKPLPEHSKDYKAKEIKSSKEKERDNPSNSIAKSNKEKERDISPVVSTPSQKVEKKEKEPKEVDKVEETKPKTKDKNEDKPKHKHKKKDRDRKEKKDRDDKPHKKDKEEKKIKEPSAKEREKTDNLFGSSPKSEPSPGSAPVDLEIEKSPLLDDESSNTSKMSSRDPSPSNEVTQTGSVPKSPSPLPSLAVTKNVQVSPQEGNINKRPRSENSTPSKKERKRDKKADKDQERRRKRKVEAETQVELEEPPIKLERKEDPSNDDSEDERKVSSTEDTKSIAHTDDPEAYMSMLRDLQTKIMGLKEQSDLQRVVQLIADTGKFEVSSHTFDFDLCLLDRATVMQLHSFLQ